MGQRLARWHAEPAQLSARAPHRFYFCRVGRRGWLCRRGAAGVLIWLPARAWLHDCLSLTRPSGGTDCHGRGGHAGGTNLFEYRHDDRAGANYWSATSPDELWRFFPRHDLSVSWALDECAHAAL